MKTFRQFFAILLMGYFVLAACGPCYAEAFKITGAWAALEADDQAAADKAKEVFPNGTAAVYCLIQWENAAEPLNITVRWYYETSEIHILDTIFAPPVPQGQGSVSLAMSEGRVLPSGTYRCEIRVDYELIKEVKFQVL